MMGQVITLEEILAVNQLFSILGSVEMIEPIQIWLLWVWQVLIKVQ